MKPNEFRCDSCQRVFEKGWTDEEAEAESKSIWGEIPKDEQSIICDECFKARTPEEVNAMGLHYQTNKS